MRNLKIGTKKPILDFEKLKAGWFLSVTRLFCAIEQTWPPGKVQCEPIAGFCLLSSIWPLRCTEVYSSNGLESARPDMLKTLCDWLKLLLVQAAGLNRTCRTGWSTLCFHGWVDVLFFAGPTLPGSLRTTARSGSTCEGTLTSRTGSTVSTTSSRSFRWGFSSSVCVYKQCACQSCALRNQPFRRHPSLKPRQ